MRLARPALALTLALAAGVAVAQEKDEGFEPAPAELLRGQALALRDGACSLEAPAGWRWLRQKEPPPTHLVFKCRGPEASLVYVVEREPKLKKDGEPWTTLPDAAVKATLDGVARSFDRQRLKASLEGEPCDVPLPKGASRQLRGTAALGDQRFHFRGYLWMHEGRIHQLSTLVPAPCADELQATIDAMARSFRSPAGK